MFKKKFFKKGKLLHIFQGISLLLVILLLWVNIGLDHKTAMVIGSVIVGVNALIEIFSK